MDPNKGKTPRDPLLEEKATSAELIKMAKQKVKARRPLPRTTEEVIMRVSYHFFQRFFYCCKRRTGVEASLTQAERMVNREMDLYKFLKNSRQAEASIHALTTFEQRRLINQQVKANLLVAPVVRGKRAREDPRKYRVKLWDSGDEETSSEEDFHYLTKQLNEKDKGGELDKITKQLLRGVIQESYKNRKHPERYYRPGHTESSDEPSNAKDEEDNFDLGNASSMNMIRPGKQYNISEADWNKLSREEQLRRMN